MKHEKIDGYLFAQMMEAGAKQLAKQAARVDALNVFPVPDGDTGTNMNLSLSSGVEEMKKSVSSNVSEVAKALSKGLLMGARGNSGVILSQLFRGFGKAIEQKQELSAVEFAQALQSGVETAYKAVMKPVEGTMLTVAKDAAKAALSKAKGTDDLALVMKAVLEEAKSSLKRTPDLLPILKQAGVVDSGGQGLVYVYEGFLDVLEGKRIEEHQDSKEESASSVLVDKKAHVENELALMIASGILSEKDIKYGYCTEFIIRLDERKKAAFHEDEFRNQLSHYGDSLLVISDDQLVKVHIHAEALHKVLKLAQDLGELIKIKIENMREQFRTVHQANLPESNGSTKKAEEQGEKEYGIIAVAMGEGIVNILKSLGADVVIRGGQTMNPSTQDFVKVGTQIKARQLIILPNNGNIIMAARQAAELMDRPVRVIPTKNIPQGMAALLSFDAGSSLDENEKEMLHATRQITAGQVTYAVRESQINQLEIKKGQFMGLKNGEIVTVADQLEECTLQLIREMLTEESEIITLIYGQDVSKEQVDALVSTLETTFPDHEVEVHDGGQPVYSYLISVE